MAAALVARRPQRTARRSDGLVTGAGALSAEWQTLLSAPELHARELTRAHVPEAPGVYLWRLAGEPVYVGTATNLRRRVWGKHMGNGLSLAGSSLRRNVCELVHGIPTPVTSNPDRQKVTRHQADSIRAWLHSCTVAWTVRNSPKDASDLEDRLRDEFMPPLNRM